MVVLVIPVFIREVTNFALFAVRIDNFVFFLSVHCLFFSGTVFALGSGECRRLYLQ